MIDLTVKTLDSRNHTFSLEDDITVREFKQHIAESVAVPAESQRLIYCGRVLQDEKKLTDYDVNGKVIHLVQKAPPQSTQRANSSGQGQGQGQGQGRNSNRSYFRHARAQVRLPRIDGNAMYLGAMSFPADAEGQGIFRPQSWGRQSHERVVIARQMLRMANVAITDIENSSSASNATENSSSSPSAPEQPQEPAQEPENQERELEQEQDDASFGLASDGGAGSLSHAASTAIHAAFSAAALNNFTTAALNTLTLLGGNNAEGGETTEPNPSDAVQSEQPQATREQEQIPVQPQSQETPQQQPPRDAVPNADSQFNAPQGGPTTPVYRTQEMGTSIGYLMCTFQRLTPYLERYRDLMLADQALPSRREPGSVEEIQRVVDRASRSLHYLAHAAHALSDVIVDLSQEPPRNLRCRPFIPQHSALLQAGIPIQVEAHISLHGRNQNVNNNNESGNPGAAAAASESAENTEATNETQGAPNPQQQTEGSGQPQQQQQPTFGTVFNMPHNVEVLMEVGAEMGGNEQNQQNFNNRNNNNNNGQPGGISAGIFPWGGAPPPDFMRSLMQMVAGQITRGVATAAAPNPATSAPGEQQATNADATTTVPAANVDGSNSNPGQSTQARGNTGTHPTTSTQTRSTPRPHVFHSNGHPFGMSLRRDGPEDPFLPCNSHHVYRTPRATSGTNPNAPRQQQQQQSTQNSTSGDQNQSATSATTLGSGTTTREANAGAENAAPSAPPPQTANNLPIVNLLNQLLSGAGAQGGQIQAAPGGLMQLFAGGIPVVQGLMANSSNQAGAGMTLMDLLGNTPGLGVSTNIGIIGPLRMDQTLQGEDLLFDLVVIVVQNITLEGWEALRTGHWEPLAGIRRPVREFFENLFGSTSLSGSEDRVVDRLISELQPTYDQLRVVGDMHTRDAVDIPATIECLLRRHFVNILRLLFDNDVDDTRFAQGLLASVKTLLTEACSVLKYSYRGTPTRIETVTQCIVTRLTEGVEPGIRQWIVNSCVSHVRSYLVHMTQLPDDEVVPLLVLRTPAGATPPAPLIQQRTAPQTQAEPEPMETDAIEPRVDVEPLDAEESATFPGHEAVPSDWVPIIARDGVRQRRQLQVQMQSQGMAGSGVGSFSDSYLGGMPSKRRKLIEQQKPRILLSPPPNRSSVSISMERLVRESVVRAGIEEVDGSAATVATDVGVRRAFGQAIRGCLHQHPQRQTAPDFPDALRFPNATKYFAEHDENSKK